MAINMMCTNNKCINYWEDNCMKNINEERIEINGDGECETFKAGISPMYDENGPILVCNTCCLNCTKELCRMIPFKCSKGIRGKCGYDDKCKQFTSKSQNELIKEVPANG